MTDKLTEISNIGMESWFRDNLVPALASYGFQTCSFDNPILGMGLSAVKNKAMA